MDLAIDFFLWCFIRVGIFFLIAVMLRATLICVCNTAPNRRASLVKLLKSHFCCSALISAVGTLSLVVVAGMIGLLGPWAMILLALPAMPCRSLVGVLNMFFTVREV